MMRRTYGRVMLMTAGVLLACTPLRAQFVNPGVNVPDRHAQRSAFPEVGEDLTEPIPAVRLSDEDVFAPTEIDPANIPAVVRWQDAGRYVGFEITVQARVVNTGKSGEVNFLNFDTDWRDKFYMVLFDDLAQTLDASVSDTFQNKLIRVKGTVQTHRGRPQIRIESMQQVEFVDE